MDTEDSDIGWERLMSDLSTAETGDAQYQLASQEIARHLQDVEINKAAHFEIAERYARFEHSIHLVGAISFVGIVVVWFIATQLFQLIEGFGHSVDATWRFAANSVIPIALVLANVIATAILYIYRFGELAKRHRDAAQLYHRLFRRIKNWQTDCPDSSFTPRLLTLVHEFRNEVSELNHNSPDIEEWAWKRAHTELQKGGTVYDIDTATSTGGPPDAPVN
uniref:DUF4231 domain-containing protein n=1 Tax=Rhodopseudomonas palustris (strain BisA53) TaxID=316055 RepID=Q07PX2_RHOP5